MSFSGGCNFDSGLRRLLAWLLLAGNLAGCGDLFPHQADADTKKKEQTERAERSALLSEEQADRPHGSKSKH